MRVHIWKCARHRPHRLNSDRALRFRGQCQLLAFSKNGNDVSWRALNQRLQTGLFHMRKTLTLHKMGRLLVEDTHVIYHHLHQNEIPSFIPPVADVAVPAQCFR